MGQLKREIVDQVISFYVNNVSWSQGIEIGAYDPDGEFFMINSDKLGPLKLRVSNQQAPLIAEKFDRLEFKGLKMKYEKGQLIVDSMTAFFKGMNRRYKVTM